MLGCNHTTEAKKRQGCNKSTESQYSYKPRLMIVTGAMVVIVIMLKTMIVTADVMVAYTEKTE
jgi:hypothetical protein